jgi:surface antigen
MKVVPALAVSCLVLAACNGLPGREQAGGTLVGSLAGTAPGSVAARAMDDSDRRRAASVLESAFTGLPATWRNRETGDSFVFTPTRSFDQRGARCRDFTIETVVGGRPDKVGGSACRQDDGNWRIQG